MSSAVKHCALQYKKVLNDKHLEQSIHQAFVALEEEIKKLRAIEQINLYSIASQFLDSLLFEPNSTINAMEVFHLRCQSIIGSEHETLKTICLGLAAIAISVAVLSTCIATGVGIGMLMGIWQFPTAYLASILALETPALLVTSVSAGVTMVVGSAVSFSFFQPARITTAVERCIEVVKECHLTDLSIEDEDELHPVNGHISDSSEHRLQQ